MTTNDQEGLLVEFHAGEQGTLVVHLSDLFSMGSIDAFLYNRILPYFISIKVIRGLPTQYDQLILLQLETAHRLHRLHKHETHLLPLFVLLIEQFNGVHLFLSVKSACDH